MSIKHFIYNRIYRRVMYRPKSRKELHKYWEEPPDEENSPEAYLEGRERSQFLVNLIRKYNDTNARILEVGCNVGRNLNFLLKAGFTNLAGVEISRKAVEKLELLHPELARTAKIYNASIEEAIKEFNTREFDVVFTMAVLEHIHRDSEWIFPHLAKITKNFLITVEDERNFSWRHFPRKYRKIFESKIGMKEVEEINCRDVEKLGKSFFARVFKKI